jgi:hypothetical protein
MKGTPEMVSAAEAADHGDDVGIVLEVMAEHAADHQDFVLEALEEERADRAIDQAEVKRLLLGRTAFTL